MFNLRFSLIIFIGCILTPNTIQSIPIDWQSSTNLSGNGFEFSPVDLQALLLSTTTTTNSIFSCTQLCHSTARCRIFDFDGQSHRCRMFEGNIATMGSVVSSSSSQSRVGSIKFRPEQFTNRGQSCSSCVGSRYLTCVSSSCQCQPHTYFDGSVCQSQKLLGGDCSNTTECRSDLNYTCLPRMQCGPLSLQSGILVGGYGNGASGNDLYGLQSPLGMSISNDSSLYVTDFNNARVIKFPEGTLLGSIVAGTGVAGNDDTQLNWPAGSYIDTYSNVYVTDALNSRVMLWYKNAIIGVRVAGTGVNGNTASTFNGASGLAIDSVGNMYISDYYNHRVMKWIPNATYGTFAAGTGTSGSGSQQLNQPYGLYLDESNSYLYIADTLNHRIQRYYLGVSLNGTTIAGGNGQGTGNHQLNTPYSICISKKTGAMYIADSNNHRVQRWTPGATSGVTIAGTTGLSGTSSALLNTPSSVVLNQNETYLYVSEMNNHRVQRFKLP